ncbi:MAG: asparagine synthase (glutamine-hydrolyzing) [Oscillospiraceae bacterium]|jgi:asparagine synthase (glutamine-hydrolysing)|nr:asparagine synthase (glutamine-hydrolyzing) [Oscillospiraceae bacterium]
MCGIAGQVARENENLEYRAADFEAMRSALLRRGPDQSGIVYSPGAALVHTRLAVIDIENGRQPMEFTRGREKYILIYNGELYNTDELRGELKSRGHKFRSRSDTEALGRAYLEWGADCVSRFNGIFAFAVWERHSQTLFLARDRIGVKPLFYTIRAGSLIFASEIAALLAHSGIPARLDKNGVAELIFLGPGRTPGCGVLSGIEELEPGECAFFHRGVMRKRKYWSLVDRENTDSFETAVETTRALVTDAIERQLVSDVPICTFLSGGLDSSIISAIAARRLSERGEALRTFSVGYRGNDKYFQSGKFQPSSDDEYIGLMNEHIGAAGYKVELDSAELADALYEATLARGLPGMADVDSSLLLFCREIKKHATVGLSGESADEIFGGYPWYRDPEVRAVNGFPWAQSAARRQEMLAPEWEIDGAGYVAARYGATLSESSALAGLSGQERRLREMVNLNFRWFMQTLLDRKDRMSMYSGLEVRVPFCDYRIAEYLYSLPWEYKDHNGVEKGLLRAAMADYLPRRVLERKKSPYPKTHNPEYMALMIQMLREVLNSRNAPVLRIVRREALEALTCDTSAVPWYGQLMTAPQTIGYFLQLNYWLESFKVEIV